jgi:hypothetical protein
VDHRIGHHGDAVLEVVFHDQALAEER